MDYICVYCGNSFTPNPRVKNQRYCSQRAVKKPGELHGKGKKWPLILITGRIKKDAKGSGIRAALDITRNTGIGILSIHGGTGVYRRYEITGGVKTSRVKCLQSWTRY